MKRRPFSRLQRLGDESGVTLVIALVIVTTVALVTGAMLTHSSANLRATVSLRSVAGTSYAADAAAKLAVNNLRLGSNAAEWTTPGFNGTWNDGDWNGWVYTNFSDGTGCFGATGTDARNSLAFAGVYPRSGTQTADPSARVECKPVPGTGVLGGSGGVTIGDPNSTDPFAAALTTLGTGPDCGNSVSSTCSGVYLKVLGTGAGGAKNSAPVGGGVASKSTMTVDNGGVATAGYVHVVGACNGTIITPDKQCSGSIAVPTPTVPASPLSSAPTTVVTTMPTPSNPGKICNFTQGSYISGQDLSTAMAKCTVSYFGAGKYYFDFLDDVPWTLSGTVIGGVPTGTLTVPGACQSPIKYPSTAGVQFVFGGSSRIEVASSANVELCGPASSDGSAPLTIYQQQTNGSGPTITPPPVVTPFSFGPEAAGNVDNPNPQPTKFDAFTDQSDGATLSAGLLTTVDALGAKWKSSKDGNDGQLILSNFADKIPAGSTVTSARVHVDFKVAPTASVASTITYTLAGVSIGSPDVNGDISLNAAQMQGISNLASSSAVAPTIRMIITGTGGGTKVPAKNDTFTVDKVALAVSGSSTTTSPPVTVNLEKTTSTVFISTKSNTGADFVVQGATYAPTGTIDVDAGQTAFIAFRWGLVANGVGFKTYPQQLFGYPLVSLPKPGSGLGTTVTVVDLQVYVCADGGACATGGTHTLTVRAMITDPAYTTHPVAGTRRIKILSWAEQH
jgi:hypothetical protein